MSKNFADSLVATAPSPATSGTSLVVTAADGSKFYVGKAFIAPANARPSTSNTEVVNITAIATDTLTIQRAQESSSARTVVTGDRIYQGLTAAIMDQLSNSQTSFVVNEVPVGSINGSNTAFTTASAFQTGSLRVTRNGVRLKGGGVDFTETGGLQGFTMVVAPLTGDVVLVDYNVYNSAFNVGTNSVITDETPTGLVNSSNTVYTAARAYVTGSLEVYIDGIKQRRGTDFTETTPGSGILTMTTAPITGQSIRINYQYNLNPSGNSDTVDGVHGSAYSGQPGQVIATTYGWELLNATLTYSSAAAPTFVATTSIDLTAYVGPGDKIWLNQSGSKYFIVVAITSSTITLYGGTDYVLANAAVTSPYVSHAKSPAGFPLNPDKWTVEVASTSVANQNLPVSGTWYNIGSLSIAIPIGIWRTEYYAGVSAQVVSAAQAAIVMTTLSTANNTESNPDITTKLRLYTSTSETKQLWGTPTKSDVIVLAAATTHYLNHKCDGASVNDITLIGADAKIIIRAICAYL